ncbi:DUF4183 domain-containing protein [Paenibacillus methanolicus]|uniref:Uncharacterized protein DUF4183 n=1 Tax=Paenibacillus methanolicus TaxID=582686 RepID=A0A5S5BUG0_9BACL|nr:DUF4183 domain-containing protein [Paenibacillus methanolicus]TYP69790.1 uncharacterized protein DUF4183 [Paenibacillus methanolicus]
MPASLIKLFIAASATAPVASGGAVTTSVLPAVFRFVATVTAPMIAGGVTTIPAAGFVNDNGDAITDLPAPPVNGYLNVYVNGMMQEANLSSLTTASLVINTIDIPVGAPVVLEVADFSNTTSTITTPPVISVPDIDIIV